MFEGENAISGWSNLAISDFYVHNLKEGDVLTVYFEDCESGTKSFKYSNVTWDLLGDGAEGQIDENEREQGFFTYTITSESAEKLKKHDLILTGDGYTITKIKHYWNVILYLLMLSCSVILKDIQLIMIKVGQKV